MIADQLYELYARQAVTEVIHRYCRGMDRMDRALTLSCWHPGGTDDHAPLYTGSAEGFIEWLWPVHAAMIGTRHAVSNIIIELDGDQAVSETCWDVWLRIPRDDGIYDLRGTGRYIDNFEEVDGIWAIRHRVSVGDMTRATKAQTPVESFDPPLIMPNNPGVAPQKSARDETDYSYRAFGMLGKLDDAG